MATNNSKKVVPLNAEQTVPAMRYYKVLEDFYNQSNELREVQKTLQAEYAFAEEKLQRVKLLEAFIDSDKAIKDAFKAFEKASKGGK